MRIITRSVWGSALQTALLFGIKYTPEENSTLNEKFNIQSGVTPGAGDSIQIPHVKYMCIGNNGHKVITGADGIPYTNPVEHEATDAALFNHLPFVLRETDNDLSAIERADYGLRKIENIEGVDYIAYYLKRMDLSSVAINLKKIIVLDGNSSVIDYIPTNENLNPIHPELPNDEVISTDGVSISASALITLLFDAADVEELINVSKIIYGNDDRAMISEIGLCSGIDKTVTSGSSTTYLEAICVQITTHITGYYPVGYSNRGFELQIEAGATEPLLAIGAE